VEANACDDTDVSISIGAVMKPAGLEASEGVLSATYLKDASDAQWPATPA
jgi:branched-chain amino acid transport system substrate-binding protein